MTVTAESLRAGQSRPTAPAVGTTLTDRLLVTAAGVLRWTHESLRWRGSPKPSAAGVELPALAGASDAEIARWGRGLAGPSIDDVRLTAALALRFGRPLRLR